MEMTAAVQAVEIGRYKRPKNSSGLGASQLAFARAVTDLQDIEPPKLIGLDKSGLQQDIVETPDKIENVLWLNLDPHGPRFCYINHTVQYL